MLPAPRMAAQPGGGAVSARRAWRMPRSTQAAGSRKMPASSATWGGSPKAACRTARSRTSTHSENPPGTSRFSRKAGQSGSPLRRQSAHSPHAA